MAAGARYTGVEVRARHVIIAGRTRYENRMTDVFTHPWLGSLFGDPRTQELMSPERMLAHMLAVEAAYARALGDTGLVDPDIAAQTADQIVAVTIDTDALRQGTGQRRGGRSRAGAQLARRIARSRTTRPCTKE